MTAGPLTGRAVVVTGAGRGLGQAYAAAIAGAGGAVVVDDIAAELAAATASAIVGAGGRAVASSHDVTDPAQADALIARCVDEFGAIDGLVNNAGRFHVAPSWQETPANVRSMIEVNVLGTYFCGSAAIRAMLPRRSGVIVNVTSGAHLGMDRMAAYGASKGAVASLTYSWAVELSDTPLRVSAISPLAHTRMTDHAARSGGLRQPSDIAPAVVFLLSDAADGLDGQVLRFDGTHLSFERPPALGAPVLERPSWTVDDIAAACRGELADARHPFGGPS